MTIKLVEDKTALKQWIHVASIGFGIPEDSERQFLELFAGLAFEMPVRSYLAVLNGQPVGTSQLFLSAGIAGIYNVTCLPEARHQGIGIALTLATLLEARRQGYRISILQASHLGYKVYLKLGFQDYGKLNIYLWENGIYRLIRKSTTPPLAPRLVREHSAPGVQVKSAGSVRTLDDLLRVRARGVTRIGATATKEILDEAK